MLSLLVSATASVGHAMPWNDYMDSGSTGNMGGEAGSFPETRPPVAVIRLAGTTVISGNGYDASVELDGSYSYDPSGGPLWYDWYERGLDGVIASRPVATITLSLGVHHIELWVMNTQLWTGRTSVQVEVISASEAIKRLLNTLSVAIPDEASLRATLAASLNASNSDNRTATIRQLQAFQYQVRVQLIRRDPELADAFITAADAVLDALEN